MVAIRGRNLRSGDLAEQLGVLLLQNLALVSPVPRTEDVGIDVVATLLADFDKTRVLAEDSFFVQIKSSTVDKIEYNNHQIDWLYKLELPYFIATIDRKSSTIKLFCCHRLLNALITNHLRKKIVIHFDDLETTDEFVAKDNENVHIGPPVAEWSISVLEENEKFSKTFYQLMKEHISIYKKNLLWSKVGWVELCRWDINEKPNVFGRAGAESRTFKESQQVVEDALDPYLFKWLMNMQLENHWSNTAESVFSLMSKIRKNITGKEN
ncbi:hypothetical protein RM392_000652 [Enterobacter cloacae]|nr:hypothetical protein [Enterobacter cloacae]